MAGQAVWQKVPSSWSKYDKDIGWADSEFAAATYRLKVLVPEGFARYGIKTTSIHANARVFANGQEIIVCGEPGYTRETSELKYYPETGYFEMASGELEIIVQASSNISVASGITQPIFLAASQLLRNCELAKYCLMLPMRPCCSLFLSIYWLLQLSMVKNVNALFQLCFVYAQR